MDNPPPSIRALAERLLAGETASTPSSEPSFSAAVRVFEKLRTLLAQFVGLDGFVALQRRALVLARTDAPSLQTVTVSAEGHLEGLEHLSDQDQAATAITTRFLGLLVTFIGEPLTLRLLGAAFSDASGRPIIELEES